jgi:hypothetical protein
MDRRTKIETKDGCALHKWETKNLAWQRGISRCEAKPRGTRILVTVVEIGDLDRASQFMREALGNADQRGRGKHEPSKPRRQPNRAPVTAK